MTLTLNGKLYKGPWTVMRTTGGETLLLSQYGRVGHIPVQQTATLKSTSAAGIGQASLRSPDGDVMQCEFRYSLAGTSVSGIGVCQNKTGHLFDMQISN
jgi:hypothetical protein